MNLRTVDIFSGCGGLSLGFQNAGFELCAAYDNWALAGSVYEQNFNHNFHLLDLNDVEIAAKHIMQYSPDVIIGGPPCQDFSIAGKRRESYRANLTVAFAKIATLSGSRLVIMENVYSIEKSQSLEIALGIFREQGYGITTRVIDASLTGVPQKRRRFFLIAGKGFLEGAFGDQLDNNLSVTPMTVYDYFGDELGIEYYYAHPRSYQRRAVFSVKEPSSTLRRVNRPIPKTYVTHSGDKVPISEAIRPLSTDERARIQTFPDGFVFSGSTSQREHLIANAVPVKLAQYVAEQIIKVLTSSEA